MALILRDLAFDDTVESYSTEFPPPHYIIRLEPFSLLSETGVGAIEGNEFESGGLKWRLIIYPNGKLQGDDDDLSVYLSVSNATSLGMNWEVDAEYVIYLQDQRTGRYICRRSHMRQKFNAFSHGRGFSKFMSKKDLMDPCNGYLVDDSCIFGAQVFVFNRPTIDRLCAKKTDVYVCNWTIQRFSKLDKEWNSRYFWYADKKWYLTVYSKGDDHAQGQCISVCLNLANPGRQNTNVKYTVRVKNQMEGGTHHQMTTQWFPCSANSFRVSNFMPIADISDTEGGFLVNDCCNVELELTVLAITRPYQRSIF